MAEKKIIGIVEENYEFAVAMKDIIQEHLSTESPKNQVEFKVYSPDLTEFNHTEAPDMWIIGLIVGSDLGDDPYYERVSPIIDRSGKPTITYSMYRLFTGEQNSDLVPDITFSENEPFESLLTLIKNKLSND